jgi:hypothetical protein
MGRPPRRCLQEETQCWSIIAAQLRIRIRFSSGGPAWMAKKYHQNTSIEEVSTQGCRRCEHQQDVRKRFHSMLEGPPNVTTCAKGNARRSSATTHRRRPPQPTSPINAKCQAMHLCSSLLRDLTCSALETIVGSGSPTPYRGGEQSRPPTRIATSTMEVTDVAVEGLGPSRRSVVVTHHSLGPPPR